MTSSHTWSLPSSHASPLLCPQALIDYTPRGVQPRPIDGIILTKFDTIDEKVRSRLVASISQACR